MRPRHMGVDGSALCTRPNRGSLKIVASQVSVFTGLCVDGCDPVLSARACNYCPPGLATTVGRFSPVNSTSRPESRAFTPPAPYPRIRAFVMLVQQIVHSVDATRLEETLLGSDGGENNEVEGSGDEAAAAGEKKKRVLFDRVVFNFPHTGKQRIHLNRNLIRDFFASTK